MKNKKLKLTGLKVQSFVTSENKIIDKQTDRIKGGVSEDREHCDTGQDFNCDPVGDLLRSFDESCHIDWGSCGYGCDGSLHGGPCRY